MWINYSLRRFSTDMCSTVWTMRPPSRLPGVNTGQNISRNKHRKLDGQSKPRRCGIHGIYLMKCIRRRLTIPKPIRFVIYHRITIRSGRGIGTMLRKSELNSHLFVPSTILRFTVLMAGDLVAREMGWNGFGEIFSEGSPRHGFTVQTAGSA